MSDRPKLSHAAYTVGWICALPVEMAAATGMLDEVHQDLAGQASNDHNTYTLGRIGQHNVVISCLPRGEYGSASASAVAMQLLSSFESIRFGLLVGIGGGIPSREADIRLGDVVVGVPTSGTTNGGVVQYDLGKATISPRKFERTGALNRPPQILLTAVSKLQALHQMEGSHMSKTVDEVVEKYSRMKDTFAARDQLVDQLFEANYYHRPPKSPSCRRCESTQAINRPYRATTEPVIHYGVIASGNQVVKDAEVRDSLGRDLGAYCVEMEAAGLVNHYPCLVVRGICDYADSHKNKEWQSYAAITSAAYTKELLLVTSHASIYQQNLAQDARLSDSEKKKNHTSIIEQICMQSLQLSDIELPRPTNHNNAEWQNVFSNVDFEEWYSGKSQDSNEGLIWIKGKPGSGKTTFMKHAFSRTIKDLQETDASVAAFLFNRTDNRLHWSQLDLFKAVLYQLLQARQDDLAGFVDRFEHKLQDAGVTWNQDELKSHLEFMFSRPRPHRTVLFLDGLDECADNGVRELAFFFRQITTTANTASSNLSICLSSREYPNVTVGRCSEVLIHQLNTKDIQQYIGRKLKAAGLNLDPGWLRLADIMISRSAGVFLWVVLVLDGVLKDYDDGRSFGYIEHRLGNIPPALEQLYEQILSTVGQADRHLTLRFFYWVLLPIKPLRLVEWHHILAWIRDQPPLSLREWRYSNYFTETHFQLERRIQTISKGLVGVKTKETHSQVAVDDKNSILGDAGSLNSEEGETRIVRIIHSSVGEFFLQGSGFSYLDPSLGCHDLGLGHLSILGTCLDYISVPELDALVRRRQRGHDGNGHRQTSSEHSSNSPPPKHVKVIKKPVRIRKRSGSEASFGTSASNYADSIYSNDSTTDSRPHSKFSEGLAKLEASQAKHPAGSSTGFTMDQYLRDSSPAVEADALERAVSIAESLHSGSSISQATMEDHPALMFYALYAFTTHAVCVDQRGIDPRSLISRLQTGGLWRRWLLLADTLDANTGMLCFAAIKGLTSWVNYLLDVGTGNNSMIGMYIDALEAAVNEYNAEITMLLLKTKHNQGKRMGACINEAIIRMITREDVDQLSWFLELISSGENTHEKLVDIYQLSEKPLFMAIQRGYAIIVKKLLLMGVDPVPAEYNGISPLHHACNSPCPDVEICRLLLHHGMSRDVLDPDGFIPAQLALRNKFSAGVALLDNYEPHSTISQPKITCRVRHIVGMESLRRPYITVAIAGGKKLLHHTDNKGWNEVQFYVPRNTLSMPEFTMREILSARDYRVRKTTWNVRYVTEDGTERASVIEKDEGGSEVHLLETMTPLSVTLDIISPSTVEFQALPHKAPPHRPSQAVAYLQRICRQAGLRSAQTKI
ncbi:hypothetical protein FE257_007373 [Aspergillus nanangensis]|uniref:NACHT domain-containing protein n=1 Tax=Aspergillus nanangensis TaxID=2582783 RepID=A0AAD4CMY2_ASPNN|nr:hypothetical protein FE257_007373 [Aspergillus nanangensis]